MIRKWPRHATAAGHEIIRLMLVKLGGLKKRLNGFQMPQCAKNEKNSAIKKLVFLDSLSKDFITFESEGYVKL